MLNLQRKVSRFRGMGWGERFERLRWYVTNPIVRVTRISLIGLYFIPAVFLRGIGVRFLASDVVNPNFGHLAHEPMLYLKTGLLGVRPKHRTIFIAPAREVASEALLDYWRPHMAVVSNPVAAVLLMPFRWIPFVAYNIFPTWVTIPDEDGTLLSGGAALDEIGLRFESQFSDSPLAEVSAEQELRGQESLRRLGVPEDAWWVCLHVRQAGYHTASEDMNAFRDVAPSDYDDAINAIVARGGWVIRTGDPSMTPIPPRPGMVDYVHSSEYQDSMNIYLIARSRFMLAADSGPPVVALMFNRPVAGTNWIPMGHGAHGSSDLYIPKLYWSDTENRYLHFAEVLLSEYRNLGRSDLFHELNLQWRDNSPEEIRQLTVEMMDRLDGVFDYSEDDERLQAEYKYLLRQNRTWETYGLNSRIGREFIRSHSNLLRNHGDNTSGPRENRC